MCLIYFVISYFVTLGIRYTLDFIIYTQTFALIKTKIHELRKVHLKNKTIKKFV